MSDARGSARRHVGVFARVVDTANRSGVVLYTLNPAGLLQTAASAQDFFRDEDGQLTPAELTGMVSGETRLRQAQLTSTQASLLALAEQTGGFAVVDSNALAAGLSRIEEDMRGYYLIGFEAKLDAKAPWSPNDVQLRVKRPGVTVRARRGLFGPAKPPPGRHMKVMHWSRPRCRRSGWGRSTSNSRACSAMTPRRDRSSTPRSSSIPPESGSATLGMGAGRRASPCSSWPSAKTACPSRGSAGKSR